MELRTRILTPSNTGNPDYIICGQGGTAVGYTGMFVQLKMEGVNVVNTSDYAAYLGGAFPVAPVALPSGLEVVVDIEDVNYLKLTVTRPGGNFEVWESTDLTVVVNKAVDYFRYDNVFEIYGYDLGNNPNQNNIHAEAIDYNPDFTIWMLPTADNEVNGKQTKAFASYIAYRKPHTKEIYFYSSNSGTYNTYAYKVNDGDNSTILSGRNGLICNSDNNDYKLIVDLTDGDSCETAFETIAKVQTMPDFYTTLIANQKGIVTAGDLTPTYPNGIGEVKSSNLLATNTAKTFIDYSTATVYYVGDSKEYPAQTHRLTYALYDHSGILKQIKVVDLDISGYPFVYDPNDTANQWEFSIEDIGDHLLKVILGNVKNEVENAYESYFNIPILNTSFFTITEEEECGTYNLNNLSAEDLIIDKYAMDEAGVFILEKSIALPKLSTTIDIVGTDNMYQYQLERTLKKNNVYGIITNDTPIYERSFVIASYCNLKNCTFEYLDKLICNAPDSTSCNDCKQEDYYNFNALTINELTYFGMLQEEYQLNYFYTALTPNKLKELYDLKGFLDRFVEYCDECKLNQTNCGCS